MTDSILELICQWHLAVIQGVTVAAGYHQTLAVQRAQEHCLDGAAITDLSAICFLGSLSLDEPNSTQTHYRWLAELVVCIFLAGRGGTPTAVEQRQTAALGDVHRQLGLEMEAGLAAGGVYCDGLADSVELTNPTIEVDRERNLTMVFIPVVVGFWCLRTDPSQQ